MAQSRVDGDLVVKGTLTPTTLNVPDGAVDDDAVAASAGIAATKVEAQYAIHYSQADGVAVAAAIVPVHTVQGATAEIVAVEVVCVDAPSGGDLAFSADLQKANVGTPTPATVLSGVIPYSATQTDCEVEVGTITSPDLVAGDTLLVVVAVSGSTGTQGQGLVVTITLREDPD